MASKLARMLILAVLGGLAIQPAGVSRPQPAAEPAPLRAGPLGSARPDRVVFLAGDLGDRDLIAFTANLAASGHPGVPLLDGPKSARGVAGFLAEFQADAVVAIGKFRDGIDELEQRLGTRTALTMEWNDRPSRELWKLWFPQAELVIVCPAEPRRLLLHAACLAGAIRAPLWVMHDSDHASLRGMLDEWQTRRVLAIGPAVALGPELSRVHLIHLPDEDAVASLALRHLGQGPIDTLVVANPADREKSKLPMSSLAPLIAVQHGGGLLLTGADGRDTAEVVRESLEHPRLRQTDHLLLVGDLEAIPMERRPNPAAGKDAFIEMEPLTPAGSEPITFATGRLFHDDPGVVLLMLARRRLLDARRNQPAPRRALVVSNPGGSLPLLELFSRTTARELSNCGYQVQALVRRDVNGDEVRALLPEQDIFLWEGHHSTLIKDFGFPEWTEPLPPSLIFLQSCLALTGDKALPVLERGSVAVVGSSTRIYSATGGAFALAYFNALLYEGRSLGAALRHAKNFLLAYALLKEKRLGMEARLTGANLRSAWAFTLWGDPTLQLPQPPAGESLPPIRAQVNGNLVTVELPEDRYEPIRSGRYQVESQPNAYLAGLVNSFGQPKTRALTPFVFVEVPLPRCRPGQVPQLRSRLADNRHAFCWDARRRCGYLLAIPRNTDRLLRFRIEWEPAGERSAWAGEQSP